MRTALDRNVAPDAAEAVELVKQCRTAAYPLEDSDSLDPLLNLVGDARYVLLGEASHGTSEYYLWRMAISQRLIREKGFTFIAVEGDWPDCYRVNRFVKGYPDSGGSASEVLHAFERWPTWMWANREVVRLVEWLRGENGDRPEGTKVGFYGLDVYSLWESLDAVIHYLEKVDPSAVADAKRAFQCFEPFGEDVQEYAWATALMPHTCEEEVVSMLSALRRRLPEYPHDGAESKFNAEQNALVARNAERYYRAMIRSNAGSWNVRDQHMVETLERLMEHHGPGARAIVWEHNTHIGDARATDMAGAGMVNVGQLVRERHQSDGVVLVGFGSHHGSVIAGKEWGAPMERLTVPSARPGSWEDIFHRAGPSDKLLLLSEDIERGRFATPRGHRAIGVVYDPDYERAGNYVPTVLPRRYDAFLALEETQALHPLHMEPQEDGELPETYPSAM